VRKALVQYYIEKRSEGGPGLEETLTPKYTPLVHELVVDNGFYDDRRESVRERSLFFVLSPSRKDAIKRF
jgi:hypothetical protein